MLCIRLHENNDSLKANLFYFPDLERGIAGKLNTSMLHEIRGKSAYDKISLSEVGKQKITLKVAFQK